MADKQHWLDRWTENRIGFHEPAVNQHLKNQLPKFNLSPGASVFMPLCGKAHDIVWLADQGYQIIGIELSSLAIESFFEENSLGFQSFENDRFVLYKSGSINLMQGDFFDLQKEDLADCSFVYDRAALIAMDQSQRPKYIQHMNSILPVSEMLLITLDYDQEEMPGPPYSVPESEVHDHYAENYSINLLERNDVIDEGPRWRKVGMTWLNESVYRLTPEASHESSR